MDVGNEEGDGVQDDAFYDVDAVEAHVSCHKCGGKGHNFARDCATPAPNGKREGDKGKANARVAGILKQEEDEVRKAKVRADIKVIAGDVAKHSISSVSAEL